MQEIYAFLVGFLDKKTVLEWALQALRLSPTKVAMDLLPATMPYDNIDLDLPVAAGTHENLCEAVMSRAQQF